VASLHAKLALLCCDKVILKENGLVFPLFYIVPDQHSLLVMFGGLDQVQAAFNSSAVQTTGSYALSGGRNSQSSEVI